METYSAMLVQIMTGVPGCAIAHGATKMMTGKRTTRSSKETYIAFTFSRSALAFRPALADFQRYALIINQWCS